MSAQVIQLLPELIRRGYQVLTVFSIRVSGVDVPHPARKNPRLEWGIDGDTVSIENDTIVSDLRFNGVRRTCRVPVRAVRKWSVR